MMSMRKLSTMKKAVKAVNMFFAADRDAVQALREFVEPSSPERENLKVSLDVFRSSTHSNFVHFTLDARKALFPYVMDLEQEFLPRT